LGAVNLILLESEDFEAESRVRLEGRRLEHIRNIHRAQVGDTLKVGKVGGLMGTGQVLEIDESSLLMNVELLVQPPAPSPVTLAVALPRPPTLQKVLQHGTAMGVKQFEFFHARRVEKSFWQSKALAETSLRHHMLLGLEQSRDTVLPEVSFHRRFRPYVEDLLQPRAQSGIVIVADPDAGEPVVSAPAGPVTLVLGPEGGFVPFEVDLFRELKLPCISLGPRILRVEAAAIALLARLSA
jgi:RsmE family RNA methyltransferase